MQTRLRIIAFGLLVWVVTAAIHARAESTNETQLLQLAHERFPDGISPSEEALFRAAANGQRFDRRPESGTDDEPTNSAAWPPERVIRADRLAWLCGEPSASALVNYRGVNMVGLRIKGPLNLDWAKFSFPLSAVRCAFDESISMTYCSLRALQLDGSCLKGLQAWGMNVEDFVSLQSDCSSDGGVNLSGSTIGGDLYCTGGHFTNSIGEALNANSTKVGGTVFLITNFSAVGEVSFASAAISHNLECDGGHFVNTNSLSAFALNVNGATIDGSLFLRNGFHAEGEVNLVGATIGGELECENGGFFNAGAFAIRAKRIEVKSSLFLNGHFQSWGAVDFSRSSIQGDLDCHGGQFVHLGAIGDALDANGIKLGGHAFLSSNFMAEGRVNLLDANIGGNLDCAGGTFVNTNDLALQAGRVTVQSVFLDRNFHSQGKASFAGAVVHGDLICENASLSNETDVALDAAGARIEGGLYLNDHASLSGKLDLQTTTAGTYIDDPASWPKPNKLLLGGFVYERFGGSAPTDPFNRIEWLHRQDAGQFLPQPYEQLAKVLREMGHEEDAEEIMIQKNRDYGRALPPFSPLRLWYGFFGEAIGFGYKSYNALWLSLVFVLMGTLFFRIGWRRQLFEATEEDAYEVEEGKIIVKTTYPAFNSVIYSLETFVPLVKLGIGDYWLPNAEAGPAIPGALGIRTGGLLRAYYWIHVLSGWLLTTLWAAGFAGLVKT